MTGQPAFAWFLAALLALHIVVQLYGGRLNLYAGPRAWLEATRKADPGRYWAFLTAEFVVMVALLAQLLL